MSNETIIRHKAIVALEKGYPEMKDAEIIITNIDGKITVGAKAMYHEVTRHDDGRIDFKPAQIGDYRLVDKNSTVEEFFGSLKEVLECVSEALKEAEAGRKFSDKA